MPAQDSPPAPSDATSVEPTRTFHCDFALQHFVPKLGRSYQTIALLAYLWSLVDPWELEPEIFLAASRIEMLFADRRTRSRAIVKLTKLGALKRKGKPTPSGSRYVLRRPQIWQLTENLQHQLAHVSRRDYRYLAGLELQLSPVQPEPKPAPVKTSKAPSKVARKKLTAFIQTFAITMGGKRRQLSWPIVAYLIEKLCELSRGTVRYTKSAKDVEAFARWLYLNKILPSEFLRVWKLLKSEHANKPTGDELRWVFEDNTPEKSEYLRCVLADLRPSLQALQGDEP